MSLELALEGNEKEPQHPQILLHTLSQPWPLQKTPPDERSDTSLPNCSPLSPLLLQGVPPFTHACSSKLQRIHKTVFHYYH